MTAIDGFDHALVGVSDLEAARVAWQRLGFTTCPRGKHIGWGTANYCIMFQDDYLELLGIVDASQFVNNLDVFLADHGQGLMGMAFASSNIDGLAKKLDGQPQDLKRLLELSDGTVEPRFKLVHPPKGTLPGLSGFFCHHLTPELMRQPEWLSHANGARRIASITVAVDDVQSAAKAYEDVFEPEDVHHRGDQTTVKTGIGEIRLVAADDLSGLVELSIEVYDLRATKSFFNEAGIGFSHTPRGLSVAPEEATGAILSFV
jgi:hypothetical protein